MGQSHVRGLTRIFCPGHVDACGMSLADRLAGQAENGQGGHCKGCFVQAAGG